jgi:DNA end-binding protein Ku
VGIYSAIDEQDIHFNQLHEACGSRIKQQRFCPVCKRDVTYDELVKGYEIEKEQYVRISQDELDQLEASESDAMEILEFVPLSAVDPIYYENTYYLVAEKLGEKAYLLLAQAMETIERVALAKFVWRGKESLHVIRSVQGRLLLHRMHYQDKIRELEVRPRSDEKPGVAEMKLATQLIESISSDTFDAKAYHDEYRQRILDLIEQKSKGKLLKLNTKAVKPATGVVDLMQRLKDSVAQTARRKGARSRPIQAQLPREVPKKANAGRQ